MTDLIGRIEKYVEREMLRARQDVEHFRAVDQKYAAAFCQGIEFGLAPVKRLIELDCDE